jgi:phage terminase small subunit
MGSKSSKFTLKKQLFVKEYLIDKNATRAAKVAGYKAKTAYSQGQRLLKDVEVAAAIAEGLDAQRKDAEERARKKGITKERWLRELALIAFADMDDFARVKVMTKYTAFGQEYEAVGVDVVNSEARKKGRSRAIKKLGESRNGIVLELHPKLPALEAIGKHLGWIIDRKELTGKDGKPLVPEETLTPEERKTKLAQLTGALAALDGEDPDGSGNDESTT